MNNVKKCAQFFVIFQTKQNELSWRRRSAALGDKHEFTMFLVKVTGTKVIGKLMFYLSRCFMKRKPDPDHT